ncbi:hypothetical protein BKA93DRAFT_792064 [Sparassis latifolia]
MFSNLSALSSYLCTSAFTSATSLSRSPFYSSVSAHSHVASPAPVPDGGWNLQRRPHPCADIYVVLEISSPPSNGGEANSREAWVHIDTTFDVLLSAALYALHRPAIHSRVVSSGCVHILNIRWCVWGSMG